MRALLAWGWTPSASRSSSRTRTSTTPASRASSRRREGAWSFPRGCWPTCGALPCPRGARPWWRAFARRASLPPRRPSLPTSSGTTRATSRPSESPSRRSPRAGRSPAAAGGLRWFPRPVTRRAVRALGAGHPHGVSRRRGALPVLHVHRLLDEGEDPIGEQVATLRRLAGRAVAHAFMGHGLQDGELAERCEKNAQHHERRSARALAAICEKPGQTGRELVPAMGWRVRPADWSETPALTRWFLVLREHRAPRPPRGDRRRPPRARRRRRESLLRCGTVGSSGRLGVSPGSALRGTSLRSTEAPSATHPPRSERRRRGRLARGARRATSMPRFTDGFGAWRAGDIP